MTRYKNNQGIDNKSIQILEEYQKNRNLRGKLFSILERDKELIELDRIRHYGDAMPKDGTLKYLNLVDEFLDFVDDDFIKIDEADLFKNLVNPTGYYLEKSGKIIDYVDYKSKDIGINKKDLIPIKKKYARAVEKMNIYMNNIDIMLRPDPIQVFWSFADEKYKGMKEEKN